MNRTEFRAQMESYRRAVGHEALTLKDPYVALDRLRELYRSFDPDERTMADEILSEWVLADNPQVRFEALVLIDEFQITSAMDALRALVNRLDLSSDPAAPFEKEKVGRVISDLEGRG